MLFKISADLQRFKDITMGHVLLMGRKPFVSPPAPPCREENMGSRATKLPPEGVCGLSIEEMDQTSQALDKTAGKFLTGGNLTAQLGPREQSVYHRLTGPFCRQTR